MNFTNTTTSATPAEEPSSGWPGPRTFTLIVAFNYLVLSLITSFFLSRKCNKNNQENDHHRPHEDDDQQQGDISSSSYSVSQNFHNHHHHHHHRGLTRESIGGGEGNDTKNHQQQQHQKKNNRRPQTKKYVERDPPAFVDPTMMTVQQQHEDETKEKHDQERQGDDDDDDFMSNTERFSTSRHSAAMSVQLPSESDIVVEVPGEMSDRTFVRGASGGERSPLLPASSSRRRGDERNRGQEQGTFCCSSSSRLLSFICNNSVVSCLRSSCCLPASYFFSQRTASLLLLSSMVAYGSSRFVQMTANVIFWHDLGPVKRGSASLWTAVVSVPAGTVLTLMQVCFLLKFYLTRLAFEGGNDGSGGGKRRKSQRGRKQELHDFGTISIFIGALCVWCPLIPCFFTFLAFLHRESTTTRTILHNSTTTNVSSTAAGDGGADDDFLHVSDLGWMKISTIFYSIPWLFTGTATIVLGVQLRKFYQPISEVAVQTSNALFAVSLIWGILTFSRGFLLLSFLMPSSFGHDTGSQYAAPMTLFGESIMHFSILGLFFWTGRNQREVLAAEREARRRDRGGGGDEDDSSQDSSGDNSGSSNDDDDDTVESGNAAAADNNNDEDSTNHNTNTLVDGRRKRHDKKKKKRKRRHGGGGGGGGDGDAATRAVQKNLIDKVGGLPVYSTWSDATSSAANTEQPSQQRLFYG